MTYEQINNTFIVKTKNVFKNKYEHIQHNKVIYCFSQTRFTEDKYKNKYREYKVYFGDVKRFILDP